MGIYLYTSSHENGDVCTMELTKLILMFCSLLVAYSKGDESTTLSEVQDQVEQTTVSSANDQSYGYFRRFNKLTNNLRQCFCFLQKPTGVPVTQRLNPSGEKLERLVIYVYKDESSNDFKLYLPNYEKQLMIPDLALDQGDILEAWPSYQIESIYNKYIELKTDRSVDLIADVAQIIDPADFNVPSDDRQNIPVDTDQIIFPNNNAVSNTAQELNPFIPGEDRMKDDSNVYDFSDTTNINVDMQILPENKEYNPDELNTNQGFDVLEDPNGMDDMNLEDKMMKFVQINQNFDVNSKPGDFVKRITDNAATPNSDNNFNININLDLSSFDEESGRPIKSDVTQPYIPDLNGDVENAVKQDYVIWPQSSDPNVVSVPNNPFNWDNVNPHYIHTTGTNVKKIIKYIPERKIINTIPTDNPKIWKNTKYDPNKRKIVTLHPQKLIKKIPQKKLIDEQNINLQTFDNWLIQELERVQFAESEAANTIDIYTLKYLIEKTLRKSGFYIGTNGLLVDSRGVKIQMANLVLRPILIGNSVEYKNLLKGKVGTFTLPTDVPYLEAVLITSIKPQKILAIVPLGKTYLPKDYSTPLSLYVQDTQQGGCNKCNANGVQTNQYYQTNFIPSRVEQYVQRYPSRWITTNYRPYSKEQGYGVQKSAQIAEPNAMQRDDLEKGSRRVFPFDQINTFIDKLYKVPLSVDNPYVVDYNVQPVVTKGVYHGVPVVKYPVGVVTPGFRIIGGNAATSSGTPVSNKGRSGSETEEVETSEVE